MVLCVKPCLKCVVYIVLHTQNNTIECYTDIESCNTVFLQIFTFHGYNVIFINWTGYMMVQNIWSMLIHVWKWGWEGGWIHITLYIRTHQYMQQNPMVWFNIQSSANNNLIDMWLDYERDIAIYTSAFIIILWFSTAVHKSILLLLYNVM